jgi:phosphohistidine swiveling domain-containing protein
MSEPLPVDDLMLTEPPASPLVEATLSLVHDLVRKAWRESGTGWDEFCRGGAMFGLGEADFARVEAKILQSGHRFAWSAEISLKERPDAYRGAEGATAESGFSHPQAPFEEAGADGRALRGVGDNVVRHAANLVGTARYIRSNEQVLALLTGGVPADTIAVIDDSGGTLTAPIIEQFAGVICAGGTVRSHLGILTREYNIPCLMNAKVAGIKDGDRVEIEVSAQAKTTEDYQKGVERTARIWMLGQERVNERP